MQKIAVGVDIGGTKTDVAIVTNNGIILSKLREPTDMSTREAVVDQVVRMIYSQLNALQIPLEKVVGVGVCLPAVVDCRTGQLVWTPPHLPQWANQPSLKELLELHLKRPVYAEYDGHACALAEQWLGACQNVANAAIIIIGTGVGGGLIINGNVYRGTNGIAGALGWWITDLCNFSMQSKTTRGCLEEQISGAAIAQRAKNALAKPNVQSILLNETTLTALDVFDAAEANDPLAKKIVQEVITYVGAAISNIVSLLDVEVVVLCGGIGQRLKSYLPEIQAFVAQYAQPVAASKVKITTTELKENAGVLGAARAVFFVSEKKGGG